MSARLILMDSTLAASSTGSAVEVPNGCSLLTISHTCTKDGSTATLTLVIEYSMDNLNWYTLETLETTISATASGVAHISALSVNPVNFIRAKVTLSASSGDWIVLVTAEVSK